MRLNSDWEVLMCLPDAWRCLDLADNPPPGFCVKGKACSLPLKYLPGICNAITRSQGKIIQVHIPHDMPFGVLERPLLFDELLTTNAQNLKTLSSETQIAGDLLFWHLPLMTNLRFLRLIGHSIARPGDHSPQLTHLDLPPLLVELVLHNRSLPEYMSQDQPSRLTTLDLKVTELGPNITDDLNLVGFSHVRLGGHMLTGDRACCAASVTHCND